MPYKKQEQRGSKKLLGEVFEPPVCETKQHERVHADGKDDASAEPLACAARDLRERPAQLLTLFASKSVNMNWLC
ncbi:hypothetical protein [Rhizobium sp. AN80A]|uniref:hypothetical protein n=1 Tax=unclassified Rhizobium TaxID=2613769 RepID=UPI0013AF03AA|nr:hypothetical protein [Rhizobium sp. AN80A]